MKEIGIEKIDQSWSAYYCFLNPYLHNPSIYSLCTGTEIVNHGNLGKFKFTHNPLKSPKILLV